MENKVNNWTYKNKIVNNIPINAFGFIYRITLSCNNKKPLTYIGKKQFYSTRKRKFGKKEIALLSDKRSKKYEYKTVETDWKNYLSSCIPLKNTIETGEYNHIKKEILKFCYSSMELKYEEVKQILIDDCLLDNNCFNANVQIKIIGKLNFK
jgi:hypothetical protein